MWPYSAINAKVASPYGGVLCAIRLSYCSSCLETCLGVIHLPVGWKGAVERRQLAHQEETLVSIPTHRSTGGEPNNTIDVDAGLVLATQYCTLAAEAGEQLNCPGFTSRPEASAGCSQSTQMYAHWCVAEDQLLLACINQQTDSPWQCGTDAWAQLKPTICLQQTTDFSSCSASACCGSLACCP